MKDKNIFEWLLWELRYSTLKEIVAGSLFTSILVLGVLGFGYATAFAITKGIQAAGGLCL